MNTSILYTEILREIERLSQFPYADKEVLKEVETRLRQHSRLIRDENPEDHFCVFFVPYNKESGKIFLGHHKKANDWIPPGGHIEKGETPVETVIREAKEELDVDITKKQLKLFSIDYLDVSSPEKKCKIHYHIWYLLETNLINFNFDTREFYDGKWVSITDIAAKVNTLSYRRVLENYEGW